MSHARELATRFAAYTDWRRQLSARISAFHDWLGESDLANPDVDLKVQHLLERLHEDKLVVAFVAEFSRGKSELINAIFFGDFGQRVLPSAAGRTTMCPTELLHDGSESPCVRLLPIETRLKDATVAEYKGYAEEWLSIPLDLAVPERMSEALARVSELKRVPIALAHKLGLHEEAEAPAAGAGTVEIPAWRHAIINFPHPLLKQGLVIFDTPGLNAIGAEPELTLSLLPNAHAVLFILAADAGVTKTDLEVWNRHLAGDDPAQRAGRLVVLNKIDGLWDELKSPREVDAEIERQVKSAAAVLGVPRAQVFGVSAQKALLARVNGDDPLLARSRIEALEAALSGKLIPGKREIVGGATRSELATLVDNVRAALDARQAGLSQQLAELRALRGKNADVITHMMERVQREKEGFERGLQRFSALRSVVTQQSNTLFDRIGMDSLRANAAATRNAIEASPFTTGMRVAMSTFFTAIRTDMTAAEKQTTELHGLMETMYEQFAAEYGLEPMSAPRFAMLRYQKEVDRLERAYNTHFNTLWNMVSRAKFALMRRFFETIASRVRHVYKVLNRDLETWLKAVMMPLETQVREHHGQLKRRLDSVRRIHAASDQLEARVAELEAAEEELVGTTSALERRVAEVLSMLEETPALPLAANA